MKTKILFIGWIAFMTSMLPTERSTKERIHKIKPWNV